MSGEQLDLLLESVHYLDNLLIIPHNDPDPDAIAGAIALRYLLTQTLGLTGRIVYKGIVGRAENRTLVRYLDHPLQPLDDTGLNQNSPVALIDTQPGAGNNPCSPKTKVAIVIDHHSRQKQTGTAGFVDVRPEVGAVSTILLEYLQAAQLDLPVWLATALFYGIKTDTRGLSREVSPADAAAYFYLQPRIDVEALAEIERAQVPAAYFKSFATTLETTLVYGDIAIAYVGGMDYPDLAAELADLLLRLEQIEWVIAMGVYRHTLLLAVRAPDQGRDAGSLAQAVVGQEGMAGGHSSMAGGQLPLKGKDPAEVVAQLRQRTLHYLGVSPDTAAHTLI